MNSTSLNDLPIEDIPTPGDKFRKLIFPVNIVKLKSAMEYIDRWAMYNSLFTETPDNASI